MYKRQVPSGSGGLWDRVGLPCPSFGREVFDLPVGGMRQAGEDVVQVSVRIESATATRFDDGVEDGAAFPGLGFADEQPILFAEGGGEMCIRDSNRT